MKYLLIICSLILCSCHVNDSIENISSIEESELNPKEIDNLEVDSDIEKWTLDKRIEVIREVRSLPYDSVTIDSSKHYVNKFFYYQGIRVKAIGLTKDLADTIAFYYKSPTTDFMANGETCPNTNSDLIEKGSLHTYRGLKYKDKHVGVATYLECDNSKFEKGLYYNSKRLGTWKIMDLKTNDIVLKEHNNDELLSELKQLTKI